MLDYFKRLFRRFRQERFAQLAASLSFTTLLSLVPLLAIIIMIGNKLPWLGSLVGYLDNFVIENLLPAQTGDVVARYAYRFSRQANRLTLGGALLLFAASIALIISIERAFNHLWQVEGRRTLAGRIALYVGAVAIFPLVAGAVLGATTYLVKLASSWTVERHWIRYAAAHGSAAMLLWGMFSVLYRVVPATRVRLGPALTGGAVAAAGITTAQRLFGLAIEQAGMYKTVYGAFAALPVFLVWLYLCWAIILLGALVAANFPGSGFDKGVARRRN